MQIVIAILAFCVIIIIHELGHFTAAKLCGIQVNEFAVGMGPVILRKKGRETNYVIRLLPIGGSVSMEGEQDSSDNPRAFNRKPVWQRMIVILAGPIMNLILGFFVAMIYVCTISNIETTTVSVVNDIPGITSQLMGSAMRSSPWRIPRSGQRSTFSTKCRTTAAALTKTETSCLISR